MPTEDGEEGEAMDATNDEDAAMMAMMGLTGFGTTKVCIIERVYALGANVILGQARGRQPRGCR